MENKLTGTIFTWLTKIILIAWGLFVILDYVMHHPYYMKALLGFQNWALLLTLFSIIGGSWYIFFRNNSSLVPKVELKINGLGIYVLILCLMVVVYGFFCFENKLFSDNPLSNLIYFTGHTLLLHGATLIIFLFGYSLGEPLTRNFKNILSSFSIGILSLALGFSLIGTIGMILGMMQLLKPWIIWVLLLFGTGLNYKSLLTLGRELVIQRTVIKVSWGGLGLGALLLIFIAINFTASIKPYPIGFDGAGLYQNTSHLIADYQALPQGGQAFNWSVIMSFGELLFNSSAISILLSHLPGILCLIAVCRIARLFMPFDKALLAASIFYVAPFISFHNYVDEKVDLGFLFISLATLLLLLEYHFGRKASESQDHPGGIVKLGQLKITGNLYMWILAGWLTGFAFGIKYTALFNFIAIVSYLVYVKVGRIAFLGFLAISTGSLFILRFDQFAAIDLDGASPLVIAAVFVLPGFLMLVIAFLKDFGKLKIVLAPVLLFTTFFVLSFAPWGIKHISEHGSFSISHIIEGKSPRPEIRIRPFLFGNTDQPEFPKFGSERFKSLLPPYHPKPKAVFISEPRGDLEKGNIPKAVLVQQRQIEYLSGSERVRREELIRYLGYEKGLPLYLSIPYDMTMNQNVPGFISLDIGFLFLLLLPLILLSRGPKGFYRNITLTGILGFLIWVSILSSLGETGHLGISQAVEHIDLLTNSQPEVIGSLFGGLYEGMMRGILFLGTPLSFLYTALSKTNLLGDVLGVIILLIFLIWIGQDQLSRMSAGLKGLAGFLFAYLFIWFFLGNAIPWYAFPALSLLPIFVAYFQAFPNKLPGKGMTLFYKWFFSLAIGLYFALNLVLHFFNTESVKNPFQFLKPPFIQFAGEQVTRSGILAMYNPFFPTLLETINKDTNSYIYRVGTHLNYHIAQNDRRVYEDNQLGLFDEITSFTSDPESFFRILKGNGFRYILYDLQAFTIDRTPEQSLLKKNQEFINQLAASEQAQLLITDRILEDPSGETYVIGDYKISGKPGLVGKLIFPGTFALFEIK